MQPCIRCGTPLPGPGASHCPACGATQVVPAAHAAATVAAGAGAVLAVQEGGRARSVPLPPGVALALGRAPDNQIVLASLGVSGRHARLEPEGATHRIVDVGSHNGLLVNGARVAQHTLADGDVVRIPDPTTSSFVTLTYVNAFAPRAAAAVRRFPLPPDGAVTLGREGVELVLQNPQVSRHHARVLAQGGRHALEDLRSVNGTFVNGERLRGTRPLAPGDVIQIGPYRLVYDGRSLDSYDQRGAMRIDARDLRREVPAARGGGTRAILNDVSLSIEPREFVALVGGSGTGKSTLMMALSGYVRADRGSVRVNGDDYYANFNAYRAVLGYVPQDDILHKMLPVEKALRYAARLRLPADTTDAEIAERVARVLEAVEMTAHRETAIERLSGGQRKRVSIASELLSDPSLMFLDEPTSGLDPGLEKKMMFTLRRLADSGRTVVLVTHATANITQCDHVVFMSAGRMVYFGPPAEALGFFGVTSGDFADIYTRLEGPADPGADVVQQLLREEYAYWRGQNPAAKAEPLLAELWELRYKRSPQHKRYVADRLARGAQGATASQRVGSARSQAPRPSATRQFAILTRRYFDLVLADRRNLAIMLAQAPIIAALLCLVSSENAVTGAIAWDAKKLLFMVSTVAVWFGVINAAREICKEAPIFQRERLADLGIAPYVYSKVAVLTGLVVVQSGLLLGVVNLKVALPDDGALFDAGAELFGTTVLAAVAGLALGLLVSAVSSTPDKATSAVPLALIPQILFAGLIFKLEGVSKLLSWFTASRWSMDALGATIDINALPAMAANGPSADALGRADAQYAHTAWNLLYCWAVLLAYAAACVWLTTFLLARKKT